MSINMCKWKLLLCFVLVQVVSSQHRWKKQSLDENDRDVKKKDGDFMIPPGIFQSAEEFKAKDDDVTKTSCMCVVFYQCENDTILVSGEGIFEARIGMDASMLDVETCPNTDEGEPMICCKLPPPSEYTPRPCGKKGGPAEVDTSWLRISSGDETSFGEYPWMLMVLGAHPEDSSNKALNLYLCGGSLIHPQVALTAAHCLKNRDPRQYMVRAGEHDTQNNEELIAHQDRLVKQILVPDNFNSKYMYNDIALLVLAEPLQPADNIGTICLPKAEDRFEESNCLATGWGRKGHGPENEFQTSLKKVDLQVVHPPSCQQQLRNTRLGRHFLLDPSFICAIGMGNKDTCQGDGGGPLVCRSSEVGSERYVQAGIVSWGIGCGGMVPAVYANVAQNRNWIDKQMYVLGFSVNEGM